VASTTPLPAPLGEDHTGRLPPLDERGAPAARPGAEPPPLRRRPGLPARAKAGARAAAKRVLRRGFHVAGGAALIEQVADLQADAQRQRDRLAAVHAAWVDAELRHSQDERLRATVESLQVNSELLKGELRQSQHTLEELGMAFAPATGLAGAAARFSELREAVNSLERRLRLVSAERGGQSEGHRPPDQLADRPAGTRGVAQTSTLFDYVGFERRFRGDPESVNAVLLERYGDLLAAHQPVLDIGCGRGELLQSLTGRGVDAAGVEPDPGMVAEGRARGVTIHQALAGAYLRRVDDGSIGSVITTHVVEHLPLDALVEMLELAVRKLRPGGVFVSETPNPASLIVLGNSYILDPTHVWPLHPSLLSFLCESAGFRDIRLRFYAPATDYHVPPVTLPPEGTPEWATTMIRELNDGLHRLNNVLFGPQEYAVVATTPS
jgi:SAM-dependent methyltransferase